MYLSEKNNPIELNFPKIKRVIPLEEVRESTYYWDMADLAEIFQHEIVEMENEVWRWKPNRFIGWIHDHAPVYTPSGASAYADGEHAYVGPKLREFRASLNLNGLVMDLHNGVFTMQEWMKFYMQMGYSLSGYGEVFGQHEASDYNLPGAIVKEDDSDEYAETVIDYMRRVHKDERLKL